VSDPNGNQVKEVMVSAASRRDARQTPDRKSLGKAIDECEEERRSRVERANQITARLVSIKNVIRGNRLPRHDYDRLCQEQTELIRELKAIEAEQAQLKTRLTRLRIDFSRTADPGFGARLIETNMLLRAILKELRKLTNGKGMEVNET
jgi:hypothetical protein